MTKRQTGLWFVLPATIHLFVFALLPISYAFWVSLYDWKVLKGSMPFVGFQKYAEVFRDESFWNALLNSARFTLMSVPTGMAVALLVAILVMRESKGTWFLRTLYYIPAVCSTVAVSMLWIYVFLPQTGLINSVAALFGMKSVDFLNHPQWAMPALAFMSIWTGLGPRMVVYLAGLLNIPPSLYEAAALDGARPLKVFWSLTMPMLAPTHLFVLITGTISAFQLFTPVYMMTKGGPLATTDVVGYHIYVEAWRKFHVSTASAQSFVLLAVIGCFAYLQWKLMKRQLEGYSTT